MKVKVAAVRTGASAYPSVAPYHPSEIYPEYPFQGTVAVGSNYVYSAIRKIFFELEYDLENFGSEAWNPFGHIIKPGMTVVLKPNFVRSRHFENKDPYAMITHPSVLRAVGDFVWIALKGEGRIIIADAPQYDANWAELMKLTQLHLMSEFYNSRRPASMEILDLRNYWSRRKHFPSMLLPLPGDPNGIVRVDLGNESAVKDVRNPKQLYGAVYHRKELVEHHTGGRQIYELSGTVMKADVVISVPKLKTHKKVGVTMNVKGLVGACTNKNLIVHYSLGRQNEGGDQYPPEHFTSMEERLIRTERWMYDVFLAKQSAPLEYLHRSIYWMHGKFIKPLGIGIPKHKRLLDVGNWHGNDSAWRMCADLLKIIMFADKDGLLHGSPQRSLFSIIDGVIGGENKGPLEPDPVKAGVILGGTNFLATDIVGARLMGFDPMKIKTLSYPLTENGWDYGAQTISDISVASSDPAIRTCLDNRSDRFCDFRPYPGWVGHIEI